MAITLARNHDEWKSLMESQETGFVRSSRDWDDLVSKQEHPILKKLDKETLTAFTKALEFRNGGLAHFDYSMLTDKLTIDDFVKLCASFGIGKELIPLIDHHRCAGRASCVSDFNFVCTPNC